jgi:hypothetical protein
MLLFVGNIQEANIPSQMGAPLTLTNSTNNNTSNNNNNINNSNDVKTTSRKFSPEKNDSFEMNEHEEDANNVVNNGRNGSKQESTVNGRLDINIKERKAYREQRNYH